MKYIPLFLIALIPLQNIYLGKLPSLGGGLNFLNILFLISLVYVLRLPANFENSNTKKYVLLMMLGWLFTYLWGGVRSGFSQETMTAFKDLMLPYLLFFIIYKLSDSVVTMKKIFLATIVPLPYMFKVFYANLSWMGFSSYKDKLRSNSGTFMELGSNEVAAFYATYTFIILAVAFKESDRRIRLFLYAVACMNIYTIVYGFSRSAYLSSLAAAALLFFLSGKTKQLVLISIVLVILSAAGVKVLPNAVFERFDSAFVETEELDDSVQKRLILWDVAKDKFASSPLVGIGYQNFKKENQFGMDTHNFYLRTLAEGGMAGFLIIVAFMVHALRKGIELFKTATDPFLKALATGFIPCMVAMMIGNYFGDRFTHYPLISYLFVYLAMVAKGVEISRKTTGDVQENNTPSHFQY